MSSVSPSPVKILIVEDNPADVRLLRHALDHQAEPYSLQVLRDGEEAIRFVEEQRKLKEIKPEPCVIVLDLHLPKYDGLAVLKAIKTEPVLSDIRIVTVTGIATPEQEREVRGLGVRLYRLKPRDLDGFIEFGRELIAICGESQTGAAA